MTIHTKFFRELFKNSDIFDSVFAIYQKKFAKKVVQLLYRRWTESSKSLQK